MEARVADATESTANKGETVLVEDERAPQDFSLTWRGGDDDSLYAFGCDANEYSKFVGDARRRRDDECWGGEDVLVEEGRAPQEPKLNC